MSKKTEDNSVLPLIVENKDPIFNNEEFYDKINKEYIELNNNYNENNGTDQHRNGFNREISKDEVEVAIWRLRTGTAPGPDQQFAEFFKHAGEKFTEAIVTMMNVIWQKGEIPTELKMADVKFLRKPGKTSYYSSSSYRPISLTCVICKLMERAILQRIVAYIEGYRLIDLTKEDFRKNHSTTNALLRLVQTVADGFNEDESILALLVGLEKAYDSIWQVSKVNQTNLEQRVTRSSSTNLDTTPKGSYSCDTSPSKRQRLGPHPRPRNANAPPTSGR
ncbi:unnamed protein product [Mytilus coruscus]|uniref:Uncharacterized protein n=1 Tax=Mytilus coruscus TaxID=42192 RepID=A0A6J8CBE4_MYTCO|nr:unnamed protein product [Mytilus coruscus]